MAWHGSPVAQDRDGRGSSGAVLQANSSVQSWLENLGLAEYIERFRQYRTLEDILNWSEIDIRDLGVRNGGHRARMISSLVMIRESSARRMRPRVQDIAVSTSQRPSYSTLPSNKVSSSQHLADSSAQFSNNGMTCTENLTVNPWYHGGISRQEAESLVPGDGKFLVRDSFTQRGDFVLTTCWKGIPLHFVINRVTVPGQAKVMYHFEEEPFNTVTDLIQYYVQNNKPITSSSGAVISVPVVRHGFSPLADVGNYDEMPVTSGDTGAMKRRTGSVPLLNFDDDEPKETKVLSTASTEKWHGSLPSIGKNELSLFEMTEKGPELPPPNSNGRGISSGVPPSPELRMATIADKERPRESGPPKPSRFPTVKKRLSERPLVVRRNQALYEDDGKDYSDYFQVRSSPGHKANCNRPDIDTVMSNLGSVDGNGTDSYFNNLANYENSLLSVENKPLDPSAFAAIKTLVLQGDAVLLARHLTTIDLDLVRVAGSFDFGYGVTSGLELMTLPQGHHLREDVIERHFSLRLFVSVTILHCTNSVERLDTINRWVQVAHELLNCFGNLFGFSAVMEGLLAEQVQRLEKSWLSFDQYYPTSKSLFRTQLCNFLKGLNDEATTILPLQNITVPHILPLAELLEDTGTMLLNSSGKPKFHLESLLAHLDAARMFAEQCDVYRKSAESLLAESSLERSFVDLLSPQTHMKFLWGSKGIHVSLLERIGKFEKVLTALSEKVEPRGQ